MAKIKTTQQGGTVTITRAGETKDTFTVGEDGVLTCRKDQVNGLLAALPGSKLVEGSGEDADPATDETADVTEPPELPKTPRSGRQ